jgi:hypothetical protein
VVGDDRRDDAERGEPSDDAEDRRRDGARPAFAGRRAARAVQQRHPRRRGHEREHEQHDRERGHWENRSLPPRAETVAADHCAFAPGASRTPSTTWPDVPAHPTPRSRAAVSLAVVC